MRQISPGGLRGHFQKGLAEERRPSFIMGGTVQFEETRGKAVVLHWVSLPPLYSAHIQLLQLSERPEDQQPSRNLQSQIGTTKHLCH